MIKTKCPNCNNQLDSNTNRSTQVAFRTSYDGRMYTCNYCRYTNFKEKFLIRYTANSTIGSSEIQTTSSSTFIREYG